MLEGLTKWKGVPTITLGPWTCFPQQAGKTHGCGSKPMVPFWLLGEFTTQFRTYFTGWIESDVHWGYGLWILRHGQMGVSGKLRASGLFTIPLGPQPRSRILSGLAFKGGSCQMPAAQGEDMLWMDKTHFAPPSETLERFNSPVKYQQRIVSMAC